jgi:hypothetical protein
VVHSLYASLRGPRPYRTQGGAAYVDLGLVRKKSAARPTASITCQQLPTAKAQVTAGLCRIGAGDGDAPYRAINYPEWFAVWPTIDD